MVNHRLESETGQVVEFVVDDGGRILDMVGEMPTDQDELVFSQGVPNHVNVQDVPEHVRSWGSERGLDEVCYYDPNGCLTCFCDAAGRMHCKKIC